MGNILFEVNGYEISETGGTLRILDGDSNIVGEFDSDSFNATTIEATNISADVATVGETVYTDEAADPTTAGELIRNGTDVKVHTGGQVRNLSDIPDEAFDPYTDEDAYDAVNALLESGSNITLSYDDVNDVLTVSSVDTQLSTQDVINIIEGNAISNLLIDDGNPVEIAGGDTHHVEIRGHVSGYRGSAGDPGWNLGWTQIMAPPTTDWNESWFGDADDSFAYISEWGDITSDTPPDEGSLSMMTEPNYSSVRWMDAGDFPVTLTFDSSSLNSYGQRVIGLSFDQDNTAQDVTLETRSGGTWSEVASVTNHQSTIKWFDIHDAPTPIEQHRLTLSNPKDGDGVWVDRVFMYTLGDAGNAFLSRKDPDIHGDLSLSGSLSVGSTYDDYIHDSIIDPGHEENLQWAGNQDDTLAFVQEWGNVTFSPDITGGEANFMFKPQPGNWAGWDGTTTFPATMTIDISDGIENNKDWGATVLGIAFDSNEYARDITVEVSSDGGSSWTEEYSVTGQTNGLVRLDMGNWSAPIEQLRITFDSPNNSSIEIDRIFKFSASASGGMPWATRYNENFYQGITVQTGGPDNSGEVVFGGGARIYEAADGELYAEANGTSLKLT